MKTKGSFVPGFTSELLHQSKKPERRALVEGWMKSLLGVKLNFLVFVLLFMNYKHYFISLAGMFSQESVPPVLRGHVTRRYAVIRAQQRRRQRFMALDV